jgi:peptidoglycan hydrolase-like protein with peptidoglycan-binding domain
MTLRSVRSWGLLAALALAPVLPAHAQDAGLIYSQPLGPDAVRAVQGKLAAMAGFTGTANGVWGADSDGALRTFQQSRGLQATGQMNQATAATMGLDPAGLIATAAPPAAAPPAATPVAAAAPAAPAPPPQPYALSGDSVRMVQARLRALGFYTGAIDGAWGGGSLAALEGFQQSHGLPADGRLNAATVQAMGIDPAAMQGP